MLTVACRLSRLSVPLLAAMLASAPAPAEPYRLQPGDTVDFALLGTAPLSRRIMIDQDGAVSIPLGGSFPAAGRTVDDLRAAVIERLKSVSFPAGVDTQGVTVWSVIYPEGVLVEIAEYRPVYVSGDVLTPSSQPFRSGVTVAQAVAVAGGVSAYRGRQDHSIDRTELGEEETAAYAAAFRTALRVARIEAELAGRGEPDFSGVPADGLDPALADRLRALELEQMAARRDDLRKSRENIRGNIASSEARLGYLRRSQANLEAETRNYEDEVKRVEGLLQKGLTPIDRLRTAQRGVLLVSTRSLDTLAAVTQVERDLSDQRRALEKLDDTQRLDNLSALQAASAEAARSRAEIEGLRMKARVVSGLGDAAQDVRYFVTRRDGAAPIRREADAGDVLQPGDLVEVALDAPAAQALAAKPTTVAAAPPAMAAAAEAETEAAQAPTPRRRSGIPLPTPAVRPN
ncbi:hypothetical protein D3218_12020 [Aureimonas flava]|uniref:Soluble ligand binding domain-containing protein n=1 Tax=Aureimonas flava TaxID=2320271 RepID=A0A3A1WKM7_9HYPH|nr:polysaccharide biosynthesis/export family protein [Aureimonas flava]RIY00021.1 hypothetical protein D3218_12020 [Aureimonas flava]